MKTRMIYTKFWYDNYISSLRAKEKLLFIYLISNEKVNICGIYELPDKYILLDTGLRQKELEIIKEKLMKDGKFIFINGWIKIINFDNYNSFSGELNDKAKEKELTIIPKEILDFIYPLDSVSNGYGESINSLININTNNIINNNISKEKRNRHLDFVFLSDEEYQKLIDLLGDDRTKEMIEKLDLYIGSKGDKYKSHYKTILNWVRMENDKKGIGKKEDWKDF